MPKTAKERKQKYLKQIKKMKRTAPKVSPVVKEYVKKQVSRQQENKMAYKASANADTLANEQIPVYPIIQFSSSGTTPNGVQSVLPLITQGVGEGQRIGNSIRCKGLYIKGHITINWSTVAGGVSSNITTPEIYIRMVILDQKDQVANGINSTSILDQAGAGFSPNGTMQGMYLPVDKKEFNVYYDKVFKIKNPLFFPSSTTAYINPNVQCTRTFSAKLLGNKLWKYGSNAATIPTSANPQILAFYIDPSNIARSNSLAVAEYSYVTTMYYEDA